MDKKQKNFIERLRRTVAQTVYAHDLIEDGDCVLIGLSGGKDSMMLLESLAILKKYGKINFSLKAMHVKVRNLSYDIDVERVSEFCRNNDVEFIYQTAPKVENRKDRTPCFICSWTRRKALFEATKKLNCNKLAFGHHLDDAVETLLMNMIYHGSISSLPEKLKMFGGRLHIIRPLIAIKDTDLQEYANIRNFPPVKHKCVYDDKSGRTDMRKIISMMQDTYDGAKINIFNSMSKIFDEYLPKLQK